MVKQHDMESPTQSRAPQANGQVEAANKELGSQTYTSLALRHDLGCDNLPNILWAYHCSPPPQCNRRNPYRLTYGTDAMIPVKIDKPSQRKSSFNPFENPFALRVDLDLVEEAREQACIRQAACKQRVARQYNSKVQPRDLNEKDLIWRRIGDARKKEEGKQHPIGKDHLKFENPSTMVCTA
ncbi:hypothetical protein CR513_56496, partial [Mucuna pruriens]